MKQQTLLCSIFALVLLTLLIPASAAWAEGTLALKGYDPVLLTEGEETKGNEDLTAERGRFVYRFASEETRARFEEDPECYGIQGDGQCAAMPSARANPGIFTVYEGKIYAFGTPNCREDFLAAPADFVKEEKQARNVGILVFDGVELLDFAGPGEVFAAAGHGRGFEVFTVGLSREPITSQGFVTVTPQYALGDTPALDILVVPGGSVGSVLNSEKAMATIRETAEDAIILSVCNGALVLARAGLLEGKEATTHHGSLDALERYAPNTKVHRDRRFVDNGRVITSAGVSAGIDASLHLVSRLMGDGIALRTANYMEYDWAPSTGDRRAAR